MGHEKVFGWRVVLVVLDRVRRLERRLRQRACDSDASIGDGGDAGDTGVDAPPGCNPSADPKDSPACVADGFGIFVDATNGKDSNGGTKEAPVQTIKHALDVAKQGSINRLYVCEGTYPEDVTIDAAHDGISLYGGWKCSNWSYSGTKAQLGAGLLPLHVDALTKAVTIADVFVKARDGVNPGDSSVAAFVSASSAVTFLRVNFTAGKGITGSSGATGSNYTAVAQTDPSIKGNNSSGITGGGPHACSLCTDAKNSTGGAGGTGGTGPGDGSDGSPNLGGSNPTDGKGGAKDPDGAGVAFVPCVPSSAGISGLADHHRASLRLHPCHPSGRCCADLENRPLPSPGPVPPCTTCAAT